MDKLQAGQLLGVAPYTIEAVEEDFSRGGWVVQVRDAARHVIVERVIPFDSVPKRRIVIENLPATGDEAADLATAIEARSEGVGSDSDVSDVPTGSVADVVAWINGDPQRALKALTAEQLREQPRKTLLAALDPLLAALDQPPAGE